MKKILFVVVSALSISFSACGPAAEDREMMHKRAKVFQDSIANAIKQSMAEAEAPGPMVIQQAPAATPAVAPQNPAAPANGK
jgi:hypothetical protein